MEDVAHRVEHKVTLVAAEHACDAAVPVAEAFEKRELKVSYQKTAKVASSIKALAVTMAKLRVEGFHIEKGRSVLDWSVDNVGRRKGRRTATQKQRVANMARRARRQKLLTAWNTKARTLWSTPVWPTVGARHLRLRAGAKRDERHATDIVFFSSVGQSQSSSSLAVTSEHMVLPNLPLHGDWVMFGGTEATSQL